MAIRTYVDGGKQAITFNNDTQPVAVYVDGDLQENVSFVPQSVQGTGSVEYLSEYKKNHIEYEVQGTTIQDGTPTPEAPIPIQNANDNGMSMVLHGKNLALATQMFNKNGKYNANVTLDGRNCVRCLQNGTTSHAIIGGFKEKTQYTFIFDYAFVRAEGTTQNGAIFYIKYTDGSQSAVAWNWQYDKFTKKIYTSTAGKTIKGIGNINADYRAWIYIDKDTFGIYEGAIADPVYEPYFRETIEIPTSIDVNGTSVPLLFSVYDKLTVDRIKNEVIYHRKSVLMSFTGQESQWSLKQTGYYQIFPEMFPPYWSPVFDKGYCTHFKKYAWNPFYNNNGFAVAGAFIFRTNGAQTLAEFKAFLQEQYANGTPVTILYGRGGTAIEHDITNTDLGQSLLNLATQNQTNYFEVQSNPNAPQAPINFTFAKWGGRNENNNNT